MKTYLMIFWLSCLGLCNLSYGKDGQLPASVVQTDSDGDGVADSMDLCPGTAAGTAVNIYGCPLAITGCDYNTNTVNLKSNGGSVGAGITTRYVLATSTGQIVQVATVPTFNGLSGTTTYMAVAVTYEGAVSNLSPGQQLSDVSAGCLDWSDALVVKVCVTNDQDSDGVPDEKDLCPGTPAGTAVNGYGCPIDVAVCDYSTSTVSLRSVGGSTGTGITTRYVLASNQGAILQVADTPVFNGLSGTATYMALAITYEGNVNNLTMGQGLSAVTGQCLEWSDALVFKACVDAPVTCDYRIGQPIVLQSTGGSIGPGIATKYLLTNKTGLLLSVSNQPMFTSSVLTEGIYTVYALTYTEDGSEQNVSANGTNTIFTLKANCMHLSPGLSLRVCTGCLQTCVPVIIKHKHI